MDTIDPTGNRNDRKTSSIAISTLILAAISFLAGVLATVFVLNLLARQQVTLSTAALIDFVFTVALGAASLILAIISINLGRQAEDALTRRSDEGIRIQSDVYIRTSDVLAKIQASTGTTEKRIEDIIAGRTALIVNEAVDKSLSKTETPSSTELAIKLKDEIAESLRAEIVSLMASSPLAAQQHLAELEETQRKRLDATAQFDAFRKGLLAKLTQQPHVRIISEGGGSIQAETPSKFWDILISVKNIRVGVAVFVEAQLQEKRFNFQKTESGKVDFARRISWRMLQDDVQVAVCALDNDLWQSPELQELAAMVDETNKRLDPRRIVLFHGSPELVAKQISSFASEN